MLANLAVNGPRYGPVSLKAMPAAFRPPAVAGRPPTLREARGHLERTMVRDALHHHKSLAGAAEALGMTRPGLSKLMWRLQIDRAGQSRDSSAAGRSR